MQKIPVSVVHYGRYDPRTKVGGVETFARNLELIFDSVDYMTPETIDVEHVAQTRLLVICDNQFVTDWPDEIPVVGFQHGVAAVKWRITKKLSDWKRARWQAKAAKRPNTIWVANSKWVGDAFAELHGNGAAHVIYYQVDVDRFDGMRDHVQHDLILHDARTVHKGIRLVNFLEKKFPSWRFQSLDCKPDEVPDRMRRARAFVHLSRYEGNSVVCNEAMAMNLPCMLTEVGLMKDADRPTDVFTLDPDLAFRDKKVLTSSFNDFVRSLDEREYEPRTWTMANASPDVHREGWLRVVQDYAEMNDSELGMENHV